MMTAEAAQNGSRFITGTASHQVISGCAISFRKVMMPTSPRPAVIGLP